MEEMTIERAVEVLKAHDALEMDDGRSKLDCVLRLAEMEEKRKDTVAAIYRSAIHDGRVL